MFQRKVRQIYHFPSSAQTSVPRVNLPNITDEGQNNPHLHASHAPYCRSKIPGALVAIGAQRELFAGMGWPFRGDKPERALSAEREGNMSGRGWRLVANATHPTPVRH